jgi:hypothetical protein
MYTELKINGNKVHFQRKSFTGHFTYTIDGVTKIIQGWYNPSTHFWLTLKRTYNIPIEGQVLEVRHIRPLYLSALEPHTYEFYLDGQLIHSTTE